MLEAVRVLNTTENVIDTNFKYNLCWLVSKEDYKVLIDEYVLSSINVV